MTSQLWPSMGGKLLMYKSQQGSMPTLTPFSGTIISFRTMSLNSKKPAQHSPLVLPPTASLKTMCVWRCVAQTRGCCAGRWVNLGQKCGNQNRRWPHAKTIYVTWNLLATTLRNPSTETGFQVIWGHRCQWGRKPLVKRLVMPYGTTQLCVATDHCLPSKVTGWKQHRRISSTSADCFCNQCQYVPQLWWRQCGKLQNWTKSHGQH